MACNGRYWRVSLTVQWSSLPTSRKITHPPSCYNPIKILLRFSPPNKKNLSQQNFLYTPYWGRLPPPPYCYLQNHVLTPFKPKYPTRGHFRLKLSPTSRCCPWWLIFFKNLFYQKNFKDTINIGGGQIRGPLFNFFVVKKCTFLHLPDPALSS